jgi:hypothetical protein
MPVSNNDTSVIDEKKKKEKTKSSDSFISDIKGFITSVITAIILILLYFSGSGLILFVCKLAQTNILPTEANCSPYTSNQANIEKIKTNIFTTFTDEEMSMKLEIPNNDRNSKNGIIDMFKNYKEKSDSNFLANYLISIMEALIQFDYSIINNTMSFLNTFPESTIIALGPPVVVFLFMFTLLLNVVYFIYLWFANMYWFFKTNTNVSGEGKPEWKDVVLFSVFPMNWFKWNIGLWCVFWLSVGFVPLLFIPFIILCYCFISCLFYKGILNGKTVSSFSIIKDLLKHYKVTIVLLISFFVVLSAFSRLGTISGIFSILTILLIYFGRIGLNIFKPVSETNLSPVVSYEQAIKTCAAPSKASNRGFLYNLFLGQNGGKITKELKTINKKLT